MRHVYRRTLPAMLLASVALIAWIAALQASAAGSQPPLPPSIVGQIINQVSVDELTTHVCHLQDKDALGYCNTQGSRYSLNPASLQEAAGYIIGQLQELPGVTVTTQPFTLSNLFPDEQSSLTLTNVVGTLTGVAPPGERRVVIVSAHYDSISDEVARGGPAPGADDNASGVAAVLEAARLLSKHTFWHTVRFVTFAGEEQGLHGSRHYANLAHRTGENIIGVINADMIAYNGDSDPRLEIHAGPEPQNVALAHALTETIEAYHLNLLPQAVLNAPIRASDHASFWDRDFPAILVIEDTEITGPTFDFNPYYHSAEDTLDKIDQAYFATMAQAIIGTIARLARPTGPNLQIRQWGPPAVSPGQIVTITLSYSNAGSAPAAGVMLTDTLSYGLAYQSDNSGLPRTFDPAGQVIWSVGEVDAGRGASFVLTATVLSELESTTLMVNRATIAGQNLDADGIDNISVVGMPVQQRWHVYMPWLVKESGE